MQEKNECARIKLNKDSKFNAYFLYITIINNIDRCGQHFDINYVGSWFALQNGVQILYPPQTNDNITLYPN